MKDIPFSTMEGYALQTVSSKLRTMIDKDQEALSEIDNHLKDIINDSKSWSRAGGESSMLEHNQDKFALLEKRLAKTCTETYDVKTMRWLHQQIHKDVGFYCIKNTISPSHDPYIGSVIDLMSQYDQNCRKKEEMENMLNQVHKKINKQKARQFISECDKDVCSAATKNTSRFETIHANNKEAVHIDHEKENGGITSEIKAKGKPGETSEVEAKENVQVEENENYFFVENGKNTHSPKGGNVCFEEKDIICSENTENVHFQIEENIQADNEANVSVNGHAENEETVFVENNENAHAKKEDNVLARNPINICSDMNIVREGDKEKVQSEEKKISCHENTTTPSRRKPLVSLNINQFRQHNSLDILKTDPLTRVRSPVLCAYLQKKKDL